MKQSLRRIVILLAVAWPLGGTGSWCQTATRPPTSAGCAASSQRVVGRRWDPVLGRGWELVADCRHPEWPARSVEVMPSRKLAMFEAGTLRAEPAAAGRVAPEAVLVHQGEGVRLWQQSGNVRIERSGVVEQAARRGDLVVVRVTRQTDDAGLVVERISGVVSGVGLVEMER